MEVSFDKSTTMSVSVQTEQLLIFPQHHGSNRVRKFVTTDCGCTLVVKCHNKGSCIQGPVEKLSWLHTNFITKQRIYLIQCYNDQSQFSFLCRYIWEIFNNHFRLLLLELELELYFYLNTVNLSDKIIILKKKLQSALIYINML